MNKLFFPTYFLLFLVSIFAANSDSLKTTLSNPTRVDSITIIGNDITQKFIILRELSFGIGDIIDSNIVKFNRERVISLGLFSKVDIYFQDLEKQNILIIEISESWYIYPIPFVFIRGGDFDRTSYGINFLYRNFRGRNETIRTILSFGYNPSFRISYFNPVIISDPDISFSIGTSYLKSANISQTAESLFQNEFDYINFSGDLSFGKRINPFNEVFLFLGFRYVESPQVFIPGITASNDRIDKIIYSGLSYSYDTRDLKQHAESGIFSNITYIHNGFTIDDINYNVFRIDFRNYHKAFESFTFKWRFAYRHSFGALVPFYDYSYLGHGEYVRGHKNNEREGHNSIVTSLEINKPILEDWHMSFKLPLLPRSLTSARIAILLNLFVDSGLTFNNRQKWGVKNFDTGWGIGITLLALPFNAFRIEYAFNEQFNGEVIFASGFSF